MTNQDAPVYQRTTAIQPGVGVQDFGGVAREYAESTNMLSAIGAKVATTASNELATQLGAEAGKNPKEGTLLLPITEFDKNFAASYTTQAQTTLGLQANKLITDSNIALASAPRVTPEMLADQQQQVGIGLQKIIAMAPASIRAQMEMQYGSIQMSQNEHVTNRMISEQRQDRKNHSLYADQLDAENAYALERSGNSAAADQLVSQAINRNNSNVSSFIYDEQLAKTSVDTIRQSKLRGRADREYDAANDRGEGEQHIRSLDHKPAGMSDPDYQVYVQSTLARAQQVQALRAQDEQLKTARMNVMIAKDPNGVTGTMLQDYYDSVSPIQGAKMELNYIQSMKAFNKESGDATTAESNWGDPAALARVGTQGINKAFDNLTTKYMQKMESMGSPMTRDEAEVQVAAAAGTEVPVFKDSVEGKLKSGNPAYIESGSHQIHMLQQMSAGHALAGLSDAAKVMDAKYESLKKSLPATEAAREATNVAYNQTTQMQKENKERWSNYLASQTKDKSDVDFALETVGLSRDKFLTTSSANMYAADILEQYSTYYQLSNGDAEVASKIVKRYVAENWGDTGVNGGNSVTLHPLEKVLGYSTNDVVPYIHQDLINYMEPRFKATKEAYDKGASNDYWETVPLDRSKHGIFSTTYEPVKVKHYTRDGNATKSETFDVVIQGNAFNDWDVAVNSPSGLRPLGQVAPYTGVISYVPNKEAIDAAYLKDHSHR